MTLVNLNSILRKAKEERYAIIATIAFNFDYVETIIKAAEEKNSPIILQIGEGVFESFNFDKLAGPMITLAKEAKIPVVVHLDHGKNIKIIMECIRKGFTSVMFDGSELTLNENIRIVKNITSLAHTLDITVEGEVGIVGGLEGSFHSDTKESEPDHYTQLKDALKFVEETNVDALAIAVGTVHGVYKSTPKIDFDRILKIKESINTPLVLHGGSGLSDNDFKKVIKNGINKINYVTNLLINAIDKAREFLKSGNCLNYMELNRVAMTEIKESIKVKMDLFGSSGKA